MAANPRYITRPEGRFVNSIPLRELACQDEHGGGPGEVDMVETRRGSNLGPKRLTIGIG